MKKDTLMIEKRENGIKIFDKEVKEKFKKESNIFIVDFLPPLDGLLPR